MYTSELIVVGKKKTAVRYSRCACFKTIYRGSLFMIEEE
jgi:hypothetical protein